MPIIAKASPPMLPAPEGLHSAVICDVVDRGIQKTPFGERHKVQIRWQLPIVNPQTERPFIVARQFTLSLHAKSLLTPFLVGLLGRKLTGAEEKEGFDVETLVGRPCLVQVVSQERDGTVFSNVQNALPLPDGMPPLKVDPAYERVKDRKTEAAKADAERDVVSAPDALPF